MAKKKETTELVENKAEKKAVDVKSILAPHVSEKSANATIKGVYTFEIHKDLNKSELSKLIKKQYNVTPLKINMINVAGEARILKGRKAQMKGYKKAIVFLKKGDKIAFA